MLHAVAPVHGAPAADLMGGILAAIGRIEAKLTPGGDAPVGGDLNAAIRLVADTLTIGQA